MEEGNQYSVTWGIAPLRQAIAEKMRAFNGIACDPDAEVTVTCGAAEALLSARYEGTGNTGAQLRIKLGAGLGLGSQFGTPSWRVVFAIEMFTHNAP